MFYLGQNASWKRRSDGRRLEYWTEDLQTAKEGLDMDGHLLRHIRRVLSIVETVSCLA